MGHGRHIVVVGKGEPKELGDVEQVRAFLTRLVDALGMRILGAPVMHDVEFDIKKLGAEPFEDEGGVTGIVVLSTSHCAIHTWPLRQLFVLNVYSCRDFDQAVVAASLEESFGARRLKVTDVSAALNYEDKPSSPQQSLAGVDA